MPTSFEDQADQMADLFRQLSMTLDKYRAVHAAELSMEDRHALADNAQHLDDFAERLTAQAVVAGLANMQDSIDNVTQATKDAQKAIKTAAQIEKVVSITAAAVTLAAAVASGNAGTVAAAAAGVASALAPATPSAQKKKQAGTAT